MDMAFGEVITVITTLENGGTQCQKDMECTSGKMAIGMKGSGEAQSSMARELTSSPMEMST